MVSRILNKDDFNYKNFVDTAGQGGFESLTSTSDSLSSVALETQKKLKDSVYKNYNHFIDASKDISVIEGEMYQISHMLADQRQTMSSLMSLSFVQEQGLKVDKDDEYRQEGSRSLAVLLEKVQGCALRRDLYHLLHDGDVAEIETESGLPIRNVHLFLLNNSLLVAPWLPPAERKGPVWYSFETLYELQSLSLQSLDSSDSAQSNPFSLPEDGGAVPQSLTQPGRVSRHFPPFTFRLSVFPEARYFQAPNAKVCREWLSMFDKARSDYVGKLVQQGDSEFACKRRTSLGVRAGSITHSGAESLLPLAAGNPDIDWLLCELSEEFDMCLVQRDFTGATELIERAKEVLAKIPAATNSSTLEEMSTRVEQHRKQLCDTLAGKKLDGLKIGCDIISNLFELSTHQVCRVGASGRSAGLRSVKLLIRLGKAVHACDLLLTQQTKVLRYRLDSIKLEDVRTLYVNRLCAVFFASLLNTTDQFLSAFRPLYHCYPLFIDWALTEMSNLVRLLSSQVSSGKTSLSTLVECVAMARDTASSQLSEVGLDLSFAITSLLYSEIQRAIGQHRDQMLKVIKHRQQEDDWQPMRVAKSADLTKLVEQFTQLGVDVSKHVDDITNQVNLSTSTVQFGKAYLQLLEDTLTLHTPELHLLVSESLVQVFKLNVRSFEAALKSQKLASRHQFILQCALFLVEEILAVACAKYEHSIRAKNDQLEAIRATSAKKMRNISKGVTGELV